MRSAQINYARIQNGQIVVRRRSSPHCGVLSLSTDGVLLLSESPSRVLLYQRPHNMSEITFKPGCRVEADEWTSDGEKICTPEKLAAIREVLDKTGPVLVQHKFLGGGCGPNDVVFDDYEEFIAYLTENARAGDKISVWSLCPFMRDIPPLAHGKCPDKDGAVPKKGAY
jgi:hypothetical protein